MLKWQRVSRELWEACQGEYCFKGGHHLIASEMGIITLLKYPYASFHHLQHIVCATFVLLITTFSKNISYSVCCGLKGCLSWICHSCHYIAETNNKLDTEQQEKLSFHQWTENNYSNIALWNMHDSMYIVGRFPQEYFPIDSDRVKRRRHIFR